MEKIYKADVTLLGKIISAEVSLMPAGGSGTWGSITGDIEDQTDLTEALGLKVDKVTGKGLSTNDYTDADKNRLADTSGTNTGDQDLSGKVDKVTGKGLIDNEITSRLSYNSAEDTLSYTRIDGGTREFGKEMSDRYTNLDTVPIVNGDIVSVVGATGNRSAVKLTDASNQNLSLATIGMVTISSIAVNNSGEVAKAGKVHELNTIAYTEGTVLYVHPTNKGKWTATKPTSGYIIKIGVVVVSHATEGIIDLEINVIPQAKDIITDSDNRFVTDTEKQKISDSAINSEVFHKSVANEIGQLDQKDTLVNDDAVLLEDSENEYAKAKTTLQKIRDFFKTTYDTVYEPAFNKNTAFNKNFGTTAGTVAEGSVIGDILTILQSI